MCHYITAILPPSAQASAIADIFRKHGRALIALENPSVQAKLLEGERYFVTSKARCDCGTGLGASQRVGRSRRRSTLDSQVENLRRKGWSDAKVSRWLQQHDEQQMAHSKTGDLTGGVDGWIALLKEVVGSARADSVCLLLHSYHGPLSEPIQIKRRSVIAEKDITSEALRAIDEDVLYEFKVSDNAER